VVEYYDLVMAKTQSVCAACLKSSVSAVTYSCSRQAAIDLAVGLGGWFITCDRGINSSKAFQFVVGDV
jgi:hypothetical protein